MIYERNITAMKMHKKLYKYIKTNNIPIKDISEATGITELRLNAIFDKNECEMYVDEYIAVCNALKLPVGYFSVNI